MKKLCSLLLAAVLFVACNNGDKGEETNSAPVTPGIDNVNGNIPDTTGTIRLNTTLPVDSTTTDSSRADSVRRR